MITDNRLIFSDAQSLVIGLGLNIVKNLVELQGGQIWFESVFRQGSTFHFTLPLANSKLTQ